MSYEITYKKNTLKFLNKLAKYSKDDFYKIDSFLVEVLATCENPCALPNAKHLKNFKDNRWRWRIGDWRIIGIVENGEFRFIEVVKIAKRDEKIYKDL